MTRSKQSTSVRENRDGCLAPDVLLRVLAAIGFAAIGIAVLAPRAGAAGIDIEVPVGGWRYSTGENEDYVQEVNYPAASVNVGAHQSKAALIRGHIDALPKDGAVARLVVNGTAMPIRLDEGGGFERPYGFGTGSNAVEVRVPQGPKKRVQFYESRANRTQAKLRVLLAWDSDGTDLDLHVVSPSGQHVWYGNRIGPSGGALDVDVTTGYGPEIYSDPAPEHGTYLVYVNYYGSGDRTDLITIADVTIVTDEGSTSEKRETFRVPMRKAGELTLVRTFVY